MPIIHHRHIKPLGEVGIWEIQETEEELRQALDLSREEDEQIQEMISKRRVEWLAGRQLLHEMSGRKIRGTCLKDEYGKPHLLNSTYHISISHSRQLVAVAAAPEPVGVDIQILVEKIDRLAYKFVREEEEAVILPETRIEHLHVYWGAKEALYKAYGRKRLDFREHLIVEPFLYREEGGLTTAWVIKEDFKAYFQVWYERWKEYVLVYALEIK
jgi:4'-phosphopantetheinyl transferase